MKRIVFRRSSGVGRRSCVAGYRVTAARRLEKPAASARTGTQKRREIPSQMCPPSPGSDGQRVHWTRHAVTTGPEPWKNRKAFIRVNFVLRDTTEIVQ